MDDGLPASWGRSFIKKTVNRCNEIFFDKQTVKRKQ